MGNVSLRYSMVKWVRTAVAPAVVATLGGLTAAPDGVILATDRTTEQEKPGDVCSTPRG